MGYSRCRREEESFPFQPPPGEVLLEGQKLLEEEDAGGLEEVRLTQATQALAHGLQRLAHAEGLGLPQGQELQDAAYACTDQRPALFMHVLRAGPHQRTHANELSGQRHKKQASALECKRPSLP